LYLLLGDLGESLTTILAEFIPDGDDKGDFEMGAPFLDQRRWLTVASDRMTGQTEDAMMAPRGLAGLMREVMTNDSNAAETALEFTALPNLGVGDESSLQRMGKAGEGRW
jgi:hypothetical protein